LTEEILDEEGKPRTISYGSILLSDLGPAVHEVLEVHYRYGNVWHVLAEDRWELRDGNLIVRTGSSREINSAVDSSAAEGQSCWPAGSRESRPGSSCPPEAALALARQPLLTWTTMKQRARRAVIGARPPSATTSRRGNSSRIGRHKPLNPFPLLRWLAELDSELANGKESGRGPAGALASDARGEPYEPGEPFPLGLGEKGAVHPDLRGEESNRRFQVFPRTEWKRLFGKAHSVVRTPYSPRQPAERMPDGRGPLGRGHRPASVQRAQLQRTSTSQLKRSANGSSSAGSGRVGLGAGPPRKRKLSM
jgi:hypothetical protein